MGLGTLSIILYAATHTGQSCESIFRAAALTVNSDLLAAGESSYLDELARASCRSNNPDLIWQIAHQESDFRFQIVRENTGQSTRIMVGQEAKDYLQDLQVQVNLAKSQQETYLPNVDIGVMQFNWAWHQQSFSSNPMRMLSPSAQVDYFLESFSQVIYQKCADRWIACYHSARSKERGTRYQNSVLRKGRVLQKQVVAYLRQFRQNLSPEERAELPMIDRKELFRILRLGQLVPEPNFEQPRFVYNPMALSLENPMSYWARSH